ncbi:hypothetical protein BV20DRAFT_972968 [Pilatotrama ljubarskyi]|nr:hypothetical protein BV20DRAFT_972968 [Pilatotrama ljubarskyi]
MTSPYRTPRYPGAPNPTPRSTQKVLRPPIHNPYDKFTQPEFDAWINDITGALKRALGRDDASLPEERVASHVVEEEVVEDSFAEVKARRLAKGKERARDEDFEVEETQPQESAEEDDGWGEPYDGEEYSGEDAEESEEEAPRVFRATEAEVIDLLSDDDEDGDAIDEDTQASEEEEAEGELAVEFDEEAEGSEAGSEEDQGSPRSSSAAGPSHVAHSFAHEVTEILDSDEEPEEAEEEEEERRVVPARFQRKPNIIAPARRESDDGEDFEGKIDEEQAEEEEHVFPPRTERKEPVDIDDPWRGPSTYAEDFYAGGDDIPTSALERGNPHALHTEDDVDELAADERVPTPDLPDPWEGPRTFAEDFYAGGDAIPTPAEGTTPSQLTPRDEGRLFIPGISPAPAEAKSREDKPVSPQTLDIDDLYADIDETAGPESSAQPATAAEEAAAASDEEASADERSPSPPSATLRTHVDWNWPPAFPGRVATRPGHIESPDHEILEISDDEEDEDEVDIPPEPVTQQSLESIQAQATADQGRHEEQESMPISTADASGLYAEFDDLYDIAPDGATFDMQGSFEPISPPGLDFGDLPAPTGAATGAEADEDVEELDMAAASAAPQPEASTILRETITGKAEFPDVFAEAAATSEEPPKESTEPRRFSVGLEEVTDEDEPDAHRPRDAPEPESKVVVVEVEDNEDEDIRSSAPPADDLDIESVRSDVPCSGMEYIVEEAMTEGRRTAEPGVDGDDEETIFLSERANSSGRGTEGPTTEHNEANPVVEEPPEDELETNPEIATTATSPEVSTTLPQASPVSTGPAALERTHSSTDFPPPVSANPNVPDPASLSHTPLSPASPEAASPSPTAEAHDATTLPANAALHPLFRKLTSASHSPSGLFTPLPNEMSASVTPEREASAVVSDGKRREQADVEEMSTAEQANAIAGEAEVAEPAVEDGERPAEVIEPSEEGPPTEDNTGSQEQDAASGPVVEEVTVEEEPMPATEGSPTEDSKPDDAVVARDYADEREATPTTDMDADAEGEVDPEYVPSEGDELEDSSMEVLQAVIPAEEDESPKSVAMADVAQQPAASEPAEEAAEPSTAPAVPNAPEKEVVTIVPEPEIAPDVDEAPASSPVDEHVEAKGEGRSLKRKRGSPAVSTTSSRVTRSKTSLSVRNAFIHHVEQKMAKSNRAKAKRKQRAQHETDEDDNVSVAQSQASASTSGGSSTAAQKMLVPSSRGTSRASSVASNAPSAYSGLSMPSPTIDRVLPSNGHHAPPPPFIHNHGILHHHHGRPTVPVAPIVQKRQPSEPQAMLSQVARRTSAEPGPSSQPAPPRAPATASSTSSPVTRSNCRFHTISVPQEENGPRILFAVPGCALGGNAELMKDEEIEDQGLVKAEDIPRLIRDVESLDFSPYLIGILRQLVGVDLLREQEVYYIPRAGDGVLLKSKKKSHRAKLKQRESISARTLSNGGAARTKDSGSIAPPSQASVSTSGESASVAGRLSVRSSAGTSASLSISELSDLEDEEAPPAKRTKESPPGEDVQADTAHRAPEGAETSSEIAPAPATATTAADQESASTSTVVPKARKLQPRRSRRLGVDASAYKPDGGESDGSDGGADAETKKGRKRGGKRGVKRTWTEENGEGATEDTSDKPKRRRVRASTSNEHKSGPDTEGVAI